MTKQAPVDVTKQDRNIGGQTTQHIKSRGKWGVKRPEGREGVKRFLAYSIAVRRTRVAPATM